MNPVSSRQRLRPGRTLALALVILALSAGPTPRAQADEGFKITSVRALIEGAQLLIQINLDRPVMPLVRAWYGEPNKPRLVMDFLGAVLADRIPERIKSPSGLARRIRLDQQKDKVRIVIDLIPDIRYEADQVLYKKLNRFVISLRAAARQ